MMSRQRADGHNGWPAWLLAASLMLMLALPAQATLTPASAPAHVQQELTQARLAGAGSFRWIGMKIYDAQLWVGNQGYLSNAPHAAKLVLNLRYARSLSGLKIADASDDEIARLGLASATQRTLWKNRMQQLFPDVRDGNQLSGVYLPEQGVRFYLDGQLLGEINDAAFARAFFAIWLDPGTSAPQLRNALLSDAAPR